MFQPKGNCALCSIQLFQFSSKYYCCDPYSIVCINCCTRKACPLCRSKSHWRRVLPLQCVSCSKKLNPQQGVKQEICGASYCKTCLARRVLTQFLSQGCPQLLQLKCGHYLDKQTVLSKLVDTCLGCGRNVAQSNTYAMADHMKLCFTCFKLQLTAYEHCLLGCVSCGAYLFSSEAAQNTELPICRQCSVNQTTIHSIIERESNASRNIIKKTREKSQIIQVSQINYDLKKQQEQFFFPDQPSIVSRFSGFESNQQGQGSKIIKLISKNSTETRVQNFKLKIVSIDKMKDICMQCRCFIDKKQLMRGQNKGQKEYLICKVCYANTHKFNYRDPSRQNLALSRAREHVSLPKNKHKQSEQNSTRTNTMKKSYLPVTETKPFNSYSYLGQTSLFSYKDPSLTPVKKSQEFSKERLCEICMQNVVGVILADKRRVCTVCANKRV